MANSIAATLTNYENAFGRRAEDVIAPFVVLRSAGVPIELFWQFIPPSSQKSIDSLIETQSTLNLLQNEVVDITFRSITCLLYTSPSPRDKRQSRMPSSA